MGRRLLPEGKVLVVSFGWPPLPGGSSVLMANLLQGFAPESYTVATVDARHAQALAPAEGDIVRLARLVPGRWGARAYDAQLPLATARLLALVRSRRPKVIVAAYPDLHLLSAARRVAAWTGLPLVAYLHDTIAEARAGHRLYAAPARRLQAQIFRDASFLFVMSEGMRDLYAARYGLAAVPLEHTYAEPLPAAPPAEPGDGRAFWAGNVYNINQQSLSRLAIALDLEDRALEVASRDDLAALAAKGVRGRQVHPTFYAGRAAYLQALQAKSLHLLALDWPEESTVHRDELGTIFPTKTPEYLASGRPLLVHCPADYFLARFVREHDCGLVVSERSLTELRAAVRRLTSDRALADRLGANALRAAARFQSGPLQDRFQRVVQAAATLRFGQKLPPEVAWASPAASTRLGVG